MSERRRSIGFLLIIGVATSVTLTFCGEDDNGTSPEIPDAQMILYDDWVHFPIHSYVARYTSSGPTEVFVDGEYNMGERFTDVNGNGVYDIGIDIFNRMEDDLNRNGMYDGPDDPWSPGVPFDDLDGDGEYRSPNMLYDVGELFCDLNGNGVRDDGGRYLVRWIRLEETNSSVTWCYEAYDSVARFRSDSGVFYCAPIRSTDTWDYQRWQRRQYTDWTFTTSDSGLTWDYPDKHTSLLVLGSDSTPADTKRVVIQNGHPAADSASFRRTVALDAELEISGVLFSDLLSITFDDCWLNNDPNRNVSHIFWEFYFSRDLGFVAVNLSGEWECFALRFASLPLPLRL